MPVTVLPTWRLPHSFLHIRAAREPLPDPAPVFTYGLLLPEVLRVASLADERMRMRVGTRWLGTLLDRDPLGLADPPPQGPVSRFFAERSIEDAFNSRSGGLLPKSLLGELASRAGGVAQEDVLRAFGRFAYDMSNAARTEGPLADDLVADARTIRHGPRVMLVRYREPTRGRLVYGFHAKTLFERLALEVQDLYLRRPKLRRCVFCDAIFVPQNNELNCRWALWDAVSHEPLEQCATNEMTEHWNTAHAAALTEADRELTRERERNRLNQRVRRALARSDNNFKHPDVLNALADRETFHDHFTKKRGPKGRPAATKIGPVPADADSADIQA